MGRFFLKLISSKVYMTIFNTLIYLHNSAIADIRAWQLGSQCTEISMTEQNNSSIQELENELVISPGKYTYKNKLINAERGLLRVCDIPLENNNRLIWNGDLYSFLSGLTWIHSHGHRDNSKTFHESINLCKKDKLYKTCGSISVFTRELLENLGIPTRLVLFLTLQPWNSYDNGHTCVEVFWEDQWQLIDIDLKQIIIIKNNNKIRAIDFPKIIKSKDYKIVKLSEAPLISGYSKINNYNYSLFAESIFASQEGIKDWYNRCADVVLINDSGYWWFHHNEKNRVLKYNAAFRYLDKNEFESKFYH